MADITCAVSINENPRPELLFAIKERIAALTRGHDAPVQLNNVTIDHAESAYRDSARFFEINNVFVDDSGCLCGDLVSRFGKGNGDVLFGKSIEDLGIDDLNLILAALCRNDMNNGREFVASGTSDRKPGFSEFIFKKYAVLARTIRKGA